ncbi:MAG: hypothetical protein ACRDEA_08265 [Microcystaceae cyanobacterium]
MIETFHFPLLQLSIQPSASPVAVPMPFARLKKQWTNNMSLLCQGQHGFGGHV